MHPLFRHPDTPPGAIREVEAELERTADGAIARFRAIGDLAHLIIPPLAAPSRADDLWRTTCCELFVGGEGGAYTEYNFSPSGQWAAYAFSGYREGMTNADAMVAVTVTADARGFTLEARIDADFPNPGRIGLTAVIDEDDGQLRYWATSFAPGKADFHADQVRTLFFDGVSAE